MKISIIGRHPDLEKGFNGLMSCNWIKGFSQLGCEVELYLPDLEHHSISDLMQKNNIESFDELSRWGCNFEIKTISNVDDICNKTDAVIWQSYRPQEDFIRKQISESDYFLTKNSPRLMSGTAERDARKATGLTNDFDLVSCSLLSDFDEIQSLLIEQKIKDQFAYVPRGFDLELLERDKNSTPVIGFDKAVKADDQELNSIRHIVSVGEYLADMNVKVEYLSLRDKVETLNSKRIPMLGFEDFYKVFLNRLWIYMPIDFDFSVHKKGKVNAKGTHRYIGLYENQIVETQLAGGLVVCRRGDIPEELVTLGTLLFNPNFCASYDTQA